MAQQCGGGGGGGMTAKLAKAKLPFCADGKDRLSALPDDLLVDILLRLVTTAEAARTSVLARRWRSLWSLLPELRFHLGPDGHRIRGILDDPEAADLRRISVTTSEGSCPDPASASAWLPAAARRLAGGLVYHNMVPRTDGVEEEEAAVRGGSIELPCFEKATTIELRLGFLGLYLPSSGTFARLAELCLYHLQLHGPCDLGEVVSSPRCPCLQMLRVSHSLGLDYLSIHSESLLYIKLERNRALQQLTIVTPTLKLLEVSFSLFNVDLIVHISAPQLEYLQWLDFYHPQYVHLGNSKQLRRLEGFLLVYGQHDSRHRNDHCLRLLQRFQDIDGSVDGYEYLMEDITMLPQATALHLNVFNQGHAFGASCFHMIRMCTGLQRLRLTLSDDTNLEEQSVCPLGCVCDQPTEWKTEKLTLTRLEEIVIIGMKGTDHEITLLKRLVTCAVNLKRFRLMYWSTTASKAIEVHQKLLSFAMPETIVTLEELPGQGVTSCGFSHQKT